MLSGSAAAGPESRQTSRSCAQAAREVCLALLTPTPLFEKLDESVVEEEYARIDG